ncbi:nuclear pore complex protein NUP88-like [Lolium rigidum]|uniref:nuclear pore complex protein NUP88-like n=1 Tax=Lolium rigidum TaxID=89674 RepID=UPI001F5E16D7|nr:nuclear pore complex protein NUP88-like [Lolium rigidum]
MARLSRTPTIHTCNFYLMLMPEMDLGYEVTHITLNTDGPSLLLAGSHNINVLYVHERVSEDGDTIICSTPRIGISRIY